MGYDEPAYRWQPGDQPDDPAAYRTNGYRNGRRDFDTGVSGAEETSGELLRRATPPGGDGGRDRPGVHVGWEIVLLLGVTAVGYLLYRREPAALQSPALDTLLVTGTAIGLLALGAGLTLRAAVPNLALGPIALAGALQYAENGDRGLPDAAVPAVVIAAAGGLLLALLVIGLHVPGWAASLAAGCGVVVYDQLRTAPVRVQGTFDPAEHALFLFGGFALLAVLGGAVTAVPPIRRLLGQMRPVGDPALRRGAAVALPVIGSLVISSVFAVAAGILMAAQSAQPIVPDTGLQWTGIAIGVALLAGTSAYGRRGGVFGTLLAVSGLTLVLDYCNRRGLHISLFVIAAATLGAGLVVTRLVETYGRPLPEAGSDEDWQTSATGTGRTTWAPDLPESWSPAVPAPNRPDRWDDGPWATNR